MQQPIQHRSLQDQAKDWLRQAVVRGDLAPGAMLTEQALTQQIGTGRGPVCA